jgi:hypothetical protein
MQSRLIKFENEVRCIFTGAWFEPMSCLSALVFFGAERQTSGDFGNMLNAKRDARGTGRCLLFPVPCFPRIITKPKVLLDIHTKRTATTSKVNWCCRCRALAAEQRKADRCRPEASVT